MVPAVDITPPDLVTRAAFAPAAVILIVATTGWYLLAVRRLHQRGQDWPSARTASLVYAELVLLVALVSGLSSYVGSSFAVGAVQHILVGTLAPLLLVLSSPLTLARRASSPRVAAAIEKVVESRAVRLISMPAVTWPIYAAFLFVLFISPLYADTFRDDPLRQLINFVSLGIGCLFFWPAAAGDRFAKPPAYWLRIMYLILLLPCYTILGMALESQSTVLASGISLSDLHLGAGLLWVSGEATGLLGAIAVFVAWLRRDERDAKQYDELQEAAAAAALAHWRATRDAATRAASRTASR
jgi:putative membrane protein